MRNRASARRVGPVASTKRASFDNSPAVSEPALTPAQGTDFGMGDQLTHWILGDLSPHARVLTALAPALLVCAYFLTGYAAYLVRSLIRGVPRQFEGELRGRTALIGSHLRIAFFWVMNPLWRLLLATGISANTVTAIAAVMGVGAATAAAFGRFALAGWLFIFSGILDIFDGRLARARHEVSPAGAAIDSILDRYTDSLMLVGLGVYYRETWVVVPVFLALVGTSVVPYVRAKSEALGFPVRDGLMQRTERIAYLGTSVALAPIFEALTSPRDPHPAHWLAIAGIVFLCITSNATAVSRFVRLVRAMTAAGTRPTPLEHNKDRAA
jgi:phosphatidylglycerophosphate synthase